MDAQELSVISAIERSPYNRLANAHEWLENNRVIIVKFENGDFILFEDWGDKIFHVHYLFEKAKGREALKLTQAAFNQIFLEYGAAALVGLIPVEARNSRLFTRWTGAKSVGIQKTPFGECEKFVLTRQKWKAN